MEMPMRMAVAVSGLVFAGGAVLVAVPTGANAAATAPQQTISGHGGRHKDHRRHSVRHRNRFIQRTVVSNKVRTVSRSDNEQLQLQLLRQLQFLRQLQRQQQQQRYEQGDIGVIGGAGGGGGSGS